ncbi:hemerythrin domain-containing protein [Glycomyces arizonensis]|uniref:hemerythrin domain-containing protein n=1 Tax=Glycomyces arizonensis TaxID=256035 RepID=UPI0004081A38|nr:hemerythrin domain-containing protein [Glycomyces arizonensis]
MPHTEQGTDLISVIIRDHREVEAAFTELERHRGRSDGRKDLTDHVIAELVRHAVAEEEYMYPAARANLPDGNKLADHETHEHTEAEEVMKRLEGLVPEDAEFERMLGRLMDIIRDHVKDEETDLLPRLQEACTEEELQDLGEKVTRAKEMAPTRPHPNAPDKPPADRILAPGVGFIDKIRDALSGRDV